MCVDAVWSGGNKKTQPAATVSTDVLVNRVIYAIDEYGIPEHTRIQLRTASEPNKFN